MTKTTDTIKKAIIADDPMSAVSRIEKEWSEAGIGNAFIFGKVMSTNSDLLLEFLQISLPELNIRSIYDIEREYDIQLSIDAHGVRLDVSARDEQGRMIDIEMQLRDEQNVSRRIRYYSGAIDQTILEKGIDYSKLSETVIIFITQFDPFGRDLIRYTFQNICVEDKTVELKDGTTKVILNALGTKGDVSPDLKEFLLLVVGAVACTAGSFADRVQDQVTIERRNSKWRREYMDWKMTLLSEREKGSLLKQVDIIVKKLKKGQELSEAAAAMEEGEEELRPIWEAVKAAAPEYDRDTILRTIKK